MKKEGWLFVPARLWVFCRAPRMLKTLSTGLLALVIAGCSAPRHDVTDRGDYYINSAHPAKGQDARVKFLILHYTAADDARSLALLTQGGVSAHYLVPKIPELRNGKPVVLQLVEEDKRAWHAGISNWNGRVNLNDSSVGIEIVNLGFTDSMLGTRTWYPFTDAQIAAVTVLARDIIRRHQIAPENVLAHSDIAPLRKQDPGKLFPWQQLAQQGIGAWPDAATVSKFLNGRAPNAPANVLLLQQTLHQYGYDKIPQTGVLDEETRLTLSAFQMHFRPADIDGNADAQTEAIAKALVAKYRTENKSG